MTRIVDLTDGADGSHDRLTGLSSAAHAKAVLRDWQESGGRHLQAMLIALGEMGAVNVAFGQGVGDHVLIETARRIAHFAQDEFGEDSYLAARLDGGSFLLALRQDCERERWQWLAEALADAVALPVRHGEDGASVRLWPRVVLARAAAGESVGLLLDRLAGGLAQERGGGATRIVWIKRERGSLGLDRRKLERDLLSAIDRDEIAVVYQPQLSVATGQLTGAEALARWNHPELGQLGAATLFALAERTDHVTHLSRHIIGCALAQAATWPRGMTLSVNITAACLSINGFADQLLAVVQEADFPVERLTVEVTEQMLIGDVEMASRTLAALRQRGAQIALDDFGCGFCNFRYLKLLPLDFLKLDRSLVESIAEDPKDLAVFRGMVAMARALKLGVVVEGVESEEQLALIVREGCAYYQGFLRSPPIDHDQFMQLAHGAT